MTLSKSYVDGFLIEWEEGEYEAQLKSMRQRSQTLKPDLPRLGRRSAKVGRVQTSAVRAQAVRERLARTVRKAPEVMVKITSSCKGMKQIGRHMDYITRKGQIDLEDQDGLLVAGREPLKDLQEEWRVGGAEEIPDQSDRRDTLNIVFSMPAQTDEVSLKRSVRAFAAEEFDGHQYVFAYHTQATDPDPNPPAHPHLHLSVKVHGRSGRRLNPRKADLQRWRENFAAQLRAHGIEANATSRLARLNRDRGVKRSTLALRKRGEAGAQGDAAKSASREESINKLESERLAYYGLVSDVLSRSEDASDRQLGKALRDAFQIPVRSTGRDVREPDR